MLEVSFLIAVEHRVFIGQFYRQFNKSSHFTIGSFSPWRLVYQSSLAMPNGFVCVACAGFHHVAYHVLRLFAVTVI